MFLNSVFETQPKSSDPEKKIVYIRFSFLSNNMNNLLPKKLKSVIDNNIPHIQMKLVFFNRKIRSYFKHKDSLPIAMKSLVVYCFTCAKCSLAYIGSTKKMFSLRVNEQQGISSRTGRPLLQPHFSTVRDHCFNICNTNFNIENFIILAKCNSEVELRITESIFINIKKPPLNIESSSFDLKIF